MCVLGQRHTRRGRGWGSRHCSLQGKQHLHSYSDRTQTQTHYLLPNIHQLTQLTRDGCPLKDMHSGDPRLSFCAHAQNIAGIDPERVNFMSPKTSRCFKWPMLCQFTHARMHKLSVTALFICKHTSCQPSSPVLSLTLSLENCLGCFVTVCVCIVSLIPRKKKNRLFWPFSGLFLLFKSLQFSHLRYRFLFCRNLWCHITTWFCK